MPTAIEVWMASMQSGSQATVNAGQVYTGTETVYDGSTKVTKDKTVSTTDKISEFYTWTPAQYNAFVAKLKSQNYFSKTEKVDPAKVASLWTTAVTEASKYYSATGGKNKMTVDGILSLYSKGNTSGDTLPTRQIYKYNDEDINAIINDAYSNAIGRPATPDEIASARKTVAPQLEQGTVSTTKQVKNKKTGKLENVVIQEAGPTKASVTAGLQKQVAAQAPEEADVNNRVNFADWLSKNLAGA